MERFIIAGTQRTGTSLIVSTLASHEDIHCLGEVFLFRKGRGSRITGSYRQYINDRRWHRSVRHYLNRKGLVEDYLDQLYSVAGPKATGFKFMLSQARQFPSALDFVRKHRIKILHVVRNNVLKTLVSRVSARERKLYHAKADTSVSKINLSPRGLVKKLDQIQGEITSWKHLARDNPYERVSYEDFIVDQVSELKKASSFIGVDYNDQMSSRLKKINSNDLRDVVENYEEIAHCLAGTMYECHLS